MQSSLGHGISVFVTDTFEERALRIVEFRPSVLGNMDEITLADIPERIKDLKNPTS